MCGRYTLTVDQEALQVALGVQGLVHPRPRYNIAPSQEVPAVIHRASSDTEGGAVGTTLRWGLVPFWADDPSIGHRLINARSETAHEKPSFRNAFRRRRCLIPADGFFEWKKTTGGKRPFWIHMESREPFTFAGLAERWTAAEGEEPLETFAILTADANEFLRPIHDRMPVILSGEDRERWLDPDTPVDDLRRLLGSFSAGPLAAREVSIRVNSPGNDDPGCLEPPSGPADGLPLFDP